MDADELAKKLAKKYETDAYRAMFNEPVHWLEDDYGVRNKMAVKPKSFCPPYRAMLVRWDPPMYAKDLFVSPPPPGESIRGYVVLGSDSKNVDGIAMSKLRKEDIFPTEQEAWDDVVLKCLCHQKRNGGGPAYIQLPPIRDTATEQRLQKELRLTKETVLENAYTIRDLCEKNLSDEMDGLSEPMLKKLTGFVDRWIETLEHQTEESEETKDE